MQVMCQKLAERENVVADLIKARDFSINMQRIAASSWMLTPFLDSHSTRNLIPLGQFSVVIQTSGMVVQKKSVGATDFHVRCEPGALLNNGDARCCRSFAC